MTATVEHTRAAFGCNRCAFQTDNLNDLVDHFLDDHLAAWFDSVYPTPTDQAMFMARAQEPDPLPSSALQPWKE